MAEHQEPALAGGTDLPRCGIHILDVASFVASIAFIAAPAAATALGDHGSVDAEEMAVLTAAGALR
jgi:hypothetical protein